MSTATKIIKSAYRLLGIKNPSTTDLSNGLESLNTFILFQSTQGINIPFITKDTLTLVVGQSSYTIATGANFNTPRPDSIVDAYLRDANSVDYPVDTTMTLQEYNDITDKSVSGRPTRLYYDSQYVSGIIYFDFAADYQYTFILNSYKPLIAITNPDNEYSIDNKYLFYLQYNLALNIAPEVPVEASPIVMAMAKKSALNIQDSNPAQYTPITLEFSRMVNYR